MGQITYRGNLSAKSFPFLSENWGRSVIVPQQDQNYVRTAFSTEDLDKDKGIPQIYYCHNVMPHQEGLQSVGYKQQLPPIPGMSGFSDIFLLRDYADNKAFLGVMSYSTGNDFYISDGSGAPWVYIRTTFPGNVTVAYVAGVAYIYIANYGCFTYDFASSTLISVTLKGLVASRVLGITYSMGYMIAWTQGVAGVATTGTTTVGNTAVIVASITGMTAGAVITGAGIPDSTTIVALGGTTVIISNPATASAAGVTLTTKPLAAMVAWSSTVDPTDFNPSLLTGAGGGPVESARGAINLCAPITLGFIVGTADNCVAAIYQNNTRYPFQFKELVNSGGLTNMDYVTWDANTSGLYAYTTSGLQLINTQQTQTMYTEITDFISGGYFEDFDDSTKEFTQYVLSSTMTKKLSVVVDRYLVMSYGINKLTHALVLDLITKRYGKLKIDHVQCFTYHLATAGILEAPKESFAFLRADGSVVTVDFNIGHALSQGTLLLGKYQHVRARMMTLDTIALESTRSGQNFDVTVLTALDGKNTVKSTPALTYSSGLTREYGCRATGINHSLLVQGGFIMDSVVLQFHINGKR